MIIGLQHITMSSKIKPRSGIINTLHIIQANVFPNKNRIQVSSVGTIEPGIRTVDRLLPLYRTFESNFKIRYILHVASGSRVAKIGLIFAMDG